MESVGKDVEKLEPLCSADRNGETAVKNSLAVSQNVKHWITLRTNYSTSGYILKIIENREANR